MSEEAAAGASGPWPVLDVVERRVLGVLVEKAKTTPEAYPLSINALVTGSNQKSNRDPVLSLDDGDIEDGLNRLKARGLVMKVIGGRVERWRHLLYETWRVNKLELAVLAELLLRGPQTEGELRTRASRMEPFDDLDALRQCLEPLVARNLVLYLTAQERRGAVVTHGFHAPKELEALKAQAAAGAPAAVVSAAPAAAPVARSDDRVPALESTLESLRGELSAARERVAALEKAVAAWQAALAQTQEDLRVLKQSLGG
jgi:uncharacterized protein YceH (UPF0502 family)